MEIVCLLLLNTCRFFIYTSTLSFFISQLISIILSEFFCWLLFICFFGVDIVAQCLIAFLLGLLLVFNISLKFIWLPFFSFYFSELAFFIWTLIEFILLLFRLRLSLNYIKTILIWQKFRDLFFFVSWIFLGFSFSLYDR